MASVIGMQGALSWVLLCLRDALAVDWLSRQPRRCCRSYIWLPHARWAILGLPGRALQVSPLLCRMRLPRYIALLWPCLGLAVLREVVLSACHAVVEGVLTLAIQPVIGNLGLFSHTKELQGNVQPSTTALWASLEATQDQASPGPRHCVTSGLHRILWTSSPYASEKQCVREHMRKSWPVGVMRGSHTRLPKLPSQQLAIISHAEAMQEQESCIDIY